MSLNREKELFSDPSNIIVSVNGVQVFLDNKFEDQALNEDPPRQSFEENLKKPTS
ncbi:hypothetical protein [Paenisporosarcina sp. OV554]|uniref:hypothetical protein n=1 Tax=Paenisporosarcina sp. OV554 TaxID=2135694 RepID=UPI000D460792|nr:hypothetical protein [Paenisporosarcina sp. OV554]PUB11378.1 hypothetical protein C8K15_1135 [Paenisporosarcina sp. OV554]